MRKVNRILWLLVTVSLLVLCLTSNLDVPKVQSQGQCPGCSGAYDSGYCTCYAWQRARNSDAWGKWFPEDLSHAHLWNDNAHKHNLQVGTIPYPNSIAVWEENIWTTDGTRFTWEGGHVAYVKKVQGTQFTVSHMNFCGRRGCPGCVTKSTFDTRGFRGGDLHFIYPPNPQPLRPHNFHRMEYGEPVTLEWYGSSDSYEVEIWVVSNACARLEDAEFLSHIWDIRGTSLNLYDLENPDAFGGSHRGWPNGWPIPLGTYYWSVKKSGGQWSGWNSFYLINCIRAESRAAANPIFRLWDWVKSQIGVKAATEDFCPPGSNPSPLPTSTPFPTPKPEEEEVRIEPTPKPAPQPSAEDHNAEDGGTVDNFWFAPGRKFHIVIRVRNIGKATWKEEHKIRLGLLTWSHKMGIEDLRFGLGSGTEVRPGETCGWIVELTAPENPGTYWQAWQMVREDGYVGWFGDLIRYEVHIQGQGSDQEKPEGSAPTPKPKPTVPPPPTPRPTTIPLSAYSSQNVEAPSYLRVEPGESFQVTIKVRNTGDAPWRKADAVALYHISSGHIGAPSWLELDSNEVIKPEETKSWKVTLRAPQYNGEWNVVWKMARGSGYWFGPEISFKVKVGASLDELHAQITGAPDKLKVDFGETFPVTLKVKNTSQTTWREEDGIRLYSISGGQLDAPSELPLDLGEHVKPGETRSWTITVTAPKSRGTWWLSYRMARGAPGYWFGDEISIEVKVGASADEYDAENAGTPTEIQAKPGERIALTIRVKNTGNGKAIWRAERGTCLYQIFHSRELADVPWKLNLNPGEEVKPGETRSWTIEFTAPDKPWVYDLKLEWKMDEKGCGYFFGEIISTKIKLKK